MIELAKKIKSHRTLKRLSQGHLGELVGYSAAAIGKIERGEVAEPAYWLQLATALDIPLPEMEALIEDAKETLGRGHLTKVEQPRSREKGFAPKIETGSTLVGARNLPVYAAAMGGDGHAIITFEAIDYVKRPSILDSVKNAYAVYVVGESMVPAFRPADMALVNPHLPPARDIDAVFFHVPPVDEAECMIKRLLSFNDKEWRLEQYNPHREFSEARPDWPICHRVVGKYSAR